MKILSDNLPTIKNKILSSPLLQKMISKSVFSAGDWCVENGEDVSGLVNRCCRIIKVLDNNRAIARCYEYCEIINFFVISDEYEILTDGKIKCNKPYFIDGIPS